jgi:lysozyme family protein
MTAANYDACLKRLLVHEGGYTDHPSDPGGPTNFGITIADYRRYVKPDATADDVRSMRVEEAKTIYKTRYWDAQYCDRLPSGVDYAVFDYGVNSGVARAGKVLRRVCGLSDSDWRVTDVVIAAVQKRDPKALVIAINDERLAFLKRLKTWPVFGTGWARRVAQVRAVSLHMATRGLADAAVPQTTPVERAKGEVPISAGSQKGTAGAIAATGAVVAQQSHNGGIQPAVIAAIVVVTIILVVGGWFAWRWHQRRQQLAPN